MHLKSIMLKGFKSFPDRTMLEFGSGVSVIVGPNGSGKSNITDAVLWALGEQSPLAVRGHTMQDVIFAGGEGTRSRSQCDVEVVIDNADGSLASEFSEISISRHIDRSGEGVYRLNGARCRLVDVMEVLSDSGLGKEMHSVISQGRVEQIIHSKPADRTVLIEEAAGLSKHRKRRRRAQLKLERTQDNLSRALDVEREARSHLRPLKRQAEAAELHARVEHQSLELREQLMHDTLLAVRGELTEAERAAAEARRKRDELSSEQSETGRRREQTERGLAEHGKARELLASRLFATSSAAERLAIRLESIRGTSEALDARLERSRRAAHAIAGGGDVAAGSSALEGLEAELRSLDHDHDAHLATELQGIEHERREAERRAADLGEQIQTKDLELERAERAADEAREAGRRAGEQVAGATRKRAALELELASIVERQQLFAGSDRQSLAQKVTAEPGFEPALAAALGGRLTAILVEDLGSGTRAIERSSPEGVRVLVKGTRPARVATQPPVAGAVRLLEHLSCEPDARELVERLLGDAWVVDGIEQVGDGFEGIAVTRAGIAYHGRAGELRRLPAGGPERVLAERSRRGEIEAELALVTADLEQRTAEANQAAEALRGADKSCDDSRARSRELRREREEALEAARRAAWLSEQRRDLGSGPADTRRAQLMGEIAAERRLAENLARERSERDKRRLHLDASIERDQKLSPLSRRLGEAMERALAATQERRTVLEQELSADEEVGERAAAELRRLAQSEYDLQARLREAGELLTQEEVKVAQIGDRETATSAELAEISQKLGEDASAPAEQPLTPEERTEIETRLERLERRRERIGPVNPLAKGEYQDALEHVEDLERQRKDLEAALAELETLIRETDRRIRESFQETFEVTARNFEEVIQHLFPGGRGRLRLVKPPQPRVVLGGAEPEPEDEQGPPASESSDDPEAALIQGAQTADEGQRETPGVEIEVTPAGKSTKRLSLLSGGEKSLVALGFLFAVFLARPCPFYILDEVEAALDDRNIDRFLRLVKGYADRSQFIIITHQRRTLEAADVLYGVSMGGDGISKVVSRRLEAEPAGPGPGEALTEAA
jgi:chromosome segregation protein